MTKLHFLALLALTATAWAECTMESEGDGGGKVETDTKKCQPQSDGKFTFGYHTSLISIPNPGQPTGTTEQATTFHLYDDKCKTLAIYEQPSCGVPWTVKDTPVVVDTIFMDVGSPSMNIKVNGASISADCKKSTNDLEADADCQAHFDNKAAKRSIAVSFQA